MGAMEHKAINEELLRSVLACVSECAYLFVHVCVFVCVCVYICDRCTCICAHNIYVCIYVPKVYMYSLCVHV